MKLTLFLLVLLRVQIISVAIDIHFEAENEDESAYDVLLSADGEQIDDESFDEDFLDMSDKQRRQVQVLPPAGSNSPTDSPRHDRTRRSTTRSSVSTTRKRTNDTDIPTTETTTMRPRGRLSNPVSAKYSESYKRWMKSLEENYDASLRPFFGMHPVTMNISIYIISLRSVSEVTMDYTIEIYFREFWLDRRLRFGAKDFDRDEINLEHHARGLIWRPDTAVTNAVTSTEPSADSLTFREHMRVRSDGRVFQTKRVSITATCNMDLHMYPFDSQKCLLEISSYGYNTEDMVYHWHSIGAIEFGPSVSLPDFQLVDHKALNQNKSFIAGNYSILTLCFILKRDWGYCIAQLLLPSTVIVAASWISLWLEDDMQFADLISVILSILFLSYSYNNVMPKVSYIKAMDIYLGACLLFVFLSLVKMAFVKYMRVKVKKAEARREHKVFAENLEKTVKEEEAELEKAIIDNNHHLAPPENNGRAGSVTPPAADEDRRTSSVSAMAQMLAFNALACQPTMAPVSGSRFGASFLPALMHRANAAAVAAKKRLGHTAQWRCLKTFHFGSQILLPVAFVGFSVFFFSIYPSVYPAPVC